MGGNDLVMKWVWIKEEMKKFVIWNSLQGTQELVPQEN